MINMYYQNCRGLQSKTGAFLRNLCMSNYDMISLTETWLSSSITDGELFEERYLVCRRDRDYNSTQQSKGGGVLIAVRMEYKSACRIDWNYSAENVWVTIT